MSELSQDEGWISGFQKDVTLSGCLTKSISSKTEERIVTLLFLKDAKIILDGKLT